MGDYKVCYDYELECRRLVVVYDGMTDKLTNENGELVITPLKYFSLRGSGHMQSPSH